MSVFRRKRTNSKGKVTTDKTYTVEFRDHADIVRRISGFTDRAASAELERQLRRLVSLRMGGIGVDAEATKFLEGCPAIVRQRLGEWGILSGQRAAAGKPLSAHLDDWRQSMKANNLSRKQVVGNSGKVARLARECDWKALSDITTTSMENWRLSAKNGGMALMTTNHYLAAAKAFCNWLAKEKRLMVNPLEHMTKLNAATDRRYERRALLLEEIGRLLKAAGDGPVVHGMSGPERALLYRFALGTGFRWSEIHTLTKGSFDFEAGVVHIRAENAKNKKDADQPIPEDLIPDLKQYMLFFPAATQAFPTMWSERGAEMLAVDLEAAGIPVVDEYGLVADFHALRHSYGTMLAKSGVPLAVAQRLMRHSDPKLTANLYTHILIQDKAEALAKLPKIEALKKSLK